MAVTKLFFFFFVASIPKTFQLKLRKDDPNPPVDPAAKAKADEANRKDFKKLLDEHKDEIGESFSSM